jgi:hypothetical protein
LAIPKLQLLLYFVVTISRRKRYSDTPNALPDWQDRLLLAGFGFARPAATSRRVADNTEASSCGRQSQFSPSAVVEMASVRHADPLALLQAVDRFDRRWPSANLNAK